MKLLYNPSFSGNAYVDFKKSPVLFNAKIVNTAGLCGIIKLHAGICSEVQEYGKRFVDYYAAMKQYMAKKPGNVMAASFEVDKFNTAKKCLEWRDTLAAGGWTKTSPTPTKRMEVLAGVEEFFHDKSDGEELLEIIKQVENGCPLPELEIITNDYYGNFAPAEVKLLEALKKRGVSFTAQAPQLDDNNISKVYSILKGKKGVVLDKNDDSFEIWNFTERDEALKYLSMLDSRDFDVWINADNKEFDNWQKLEGKKLSGSEMSGIPQIAQLLNIGLTIFERPLNVYNIVEWLNTSLNPLPYKFRKGLARRICDSGGYYNDKCRKYIAEKVEEDASLKTEIEKFLPDINKPYFEESDIEVSAITDFIQNVRSWCSAQLSFSVNAGVDQLGYVVNQANTMLLLLEEYGSKLIPYSSIELMTAVFSMNKTMDQYPAQAGCKNIVNSYSNFCDSAENTVWCDFYSCGNAGKLTYSFLSPAEAEVFQEKLSLWKPEKENAYLRNLLLTPFVKTQKKLVLVTLDRINSSPAPKSPVFIQLAKYFADKDEPNDFEKNLLCPFVKQKSFDEAKYKAVKKIDNRMEHDQEFVEIQNADLIKQNWEDHQSATSLESIIPHPLDYVIDNHAKFSANPVNTINDISTTKGKVAHKIIQILFSPKKDVKDSGTYPYIKNQITEKFDQVFKETVQSEGAILLLADNKLELQRFREQMKENLEALLKGIKENNLHVVACEKNIGYQTDDDGVVIQHGIIGNLDVKGFVDMLLEDKNGNLYIFDFKWTSSSKRHANLLAENKSVQLTLYKELVSKEMKLPVKAVAYFLMPAAQFVSCQDFTGNMELKQVYVVPDRRSKDLLKEIQNSYDYRKNEILSGKLEETTGWKEVNINYEDQRDALGLMPMDYYNEEKCGPYSDIGLIKGRKSEE